VTAPAADTGWMTRAACAGMNPDLFFPVQSNGTTVSAPKAVCGGCPVRVDCAMHAINEGEEHGIWGGLTERERRRVRRGRARMSAVAS
jgi:WhiB family redox-sensing transcriptional regulator